MANKMIIGYLHMGPSQHGVCRYGRLLAAEAQTRDDFKVLEASVTLTEDRKHNREMLINAAQKLNQAEIVHIQYSFINNKSLWGEGWKQLNYLQCFKHYCSSPLIVTLHDVYNPPPNLKNTLKILYSWLRGYKSPIKKESIQTKQSYIYKPRILVTFIRFVRNIYGLKALCFRWLLKQVKFVIVCSQEEAQRLSVTEEVKKTKVIPHFVEKRSLNMKSGEAKAALNLDGSTTVTLLGFIHGRKGHQLMVEALPELPQNVKVIFAGGASPGNEQFVEQLLSQAKEKRVDDRLRVTGYLSEEELEIYLAATDLAVCPFKFFSASGSLSTWISAACPILAYDLPQIGYYNKLEHEAIKTFQPYTSTALAQAIKKLLVISRDSEEASIARLRQELSISKIFDKHLNYYT